MATAARKHPTYDAHGVPTETVQIVRRQIVGEVTLSENGTENPLQALFAMAATYIGENETSEAILLEFNLFGRTFRAGIDPAPEPTSTPVLDPWDN